MSGTTPVWHWRATIVLGVVVAATILPVVSGEDPEAPRGGDGYPKTREPAIAPAAFSAGRRGPVPTVGGGDVLVSHWESPDGKHQTTVVDVRTRTMAVYHIDPRSGAIALKSVRNLGWDLQIDDYNGGSPSTREIRELVERK